MLLEESWKNGLKKHIWIFTVIGQRKFDSASDTIGFMVDPEHHLVRLHVLMYMVCSRH